MSESISREKLEKPDAKLERLYSQVSNWEDILRSVKMGEDLFIANLKEWNLDKLGIDTSRVHAYSDIEVQAFILGIPSRRIPDEIVVKSYLTYGAHWLDDFFDNPAGIPYEKLFQDRGDIRKVLSNIGAIGQVGSLMADKVPNPDGVYKGLARMLYGGLVQRSSTREQRTMLMQEYRDLGTTGVDNRIVEEIRTIQPEAYWLTNKTLLEFMNAGEKNSDFTVAELWNLIYTPALYYHDIVEEERIGESSFENSEKPRDEEMIKMVRVGAKYLSDFPDERLSLRIQQLQVLLAAFRKNLPDYIVSEYQSIINQFGQRKTYLSIRS